jgi:NADPH oxidase 1
MVNQFFTLQFSFLHVELWKLRPETALQIHYTQPGGITGHFMLLCMLFIYTSAHSKFRLKSFEIFKLTHYLFLPFLLALYTHATGCFVRDTAEPFSPFTRTFFRYCIGYQSWRWEVGAGLLYFFDRVYRAIQAKELQLMSVSRYPCKILELRFEKKSFKYKAGQWLLVNIPELSGTQWHPFTISSCPFDDYVAVHINQSGDWTTNMAERLGIDVIAGLPVIQSLKSPAIRIDGPFGAPADVLGNEVAILIGAGIGATPWMSVLRTIYHERGQKKLPTDSRRIEFIWICKTEASLKLFHTFLSSLKTKAPTLLPGADSSIFLRIRLFLTQVSQFSSDTTGDVGKEKVAPSGVRYQINLGRPNFKDIFDHIGSKIESNPGRQILKRNSSVSVTVRKKKRVGVYFCGAEAIAKDISEAADAAANADVTFGFSNNHYL